MTHNFKKPSIFIKNMEKQNQGKPIDNNEGNAEFVPAVITKIKTGIKMNVNAKGFLNFMKANSIYLDKSILIKSRTSLIIKP